MKLLIDMDGIAEELQNNVIALETERQREKYDEYVSEHGSGDGYRIQPEYWYSLSEEHKTEARLRSISLLKYFAVEM